MKKQREEIVVGEWQRDASGRRYRKIGDCIEYAMEITTTHGTMYADDLAKYNKRVVEQPAPEKPKVIGKSCPVKAFRNNMHGNCDTDCAFYNGSGCRFGVLDPEHTTDTKNKYCPFMNKCIDTCALYRNGCTLKF